MKIDNRYELWELVSLLNDKKKYFIYKIGITKIWIEYLLWDWINNYPWWFWEYQLLPYEDNIWFKEKNENKET